MLSTGERLSSAILARYFKGSLLIDAREIIKTDENYGSAIVDFDATNSLIRKRILRKNKLFLVPGFIASTA